MVWKINHRYCSEHWATPWHDPSEEPGDLFDTFAEFYPECPIGDRYPSSFDAEKYFLSSSKAEVSCFKNDFDDLPEATIK
jgi:hypothetical protein